MDNIKLKRITFAGGDDTQEVEMPTQCIKVLVKNFTDNDIFVGIGGVADVNMDNMVAIKSNCYQIVLINENPDCYHYFRTLTINGQGSGIVECMQLLF
jgi:hypothetical protein